MNSDPARTYRYAAAQSATPTGLVVLLYDAILQALHRAADAMRRSAIEERVKAFDHALAIIGELEVSLNHEKGGDVAKSLSRFYAVARQKIVEANANNSPDSLRELLAMFLPVRDAWREVDRDVQGGMQAALPGAPAAAAAAPAQRRVPPSIVNDEPAHSGRWSG